MQTELIKINDQPYQEGGRSLRLDAQATLDAVFQCSDCPEALISGLRGKITWQKRNEYSIERTLTIPGLAPQWIGALLACGARAIFEDGRETLLKDLFMTSRQPRGLAAVQVPLDVPGRLWGEARTGTSPADFPIVWALAVVDVADGFVQQARVALTGVWTQSVALAESASKLVGNPLTNEWIDKIAAAVEGEVNPQGDYRGSVEYRRAMAGVMTRRALEKCYQGAEQA
jgi:CO/xanthine dehydrogenase FAD-binding subunit